MVFAAFMTTIYFAVVFEGTFLATGLVNTLLRLLYPDAPSPRFNALRIALLAGAAPVIIVVALFIKHIYFA